MNTIISGSFLPFFTYRDMALAGRPPEPATVFIGIEDLAFDMVTAALSNLK